MSSTTEQLHKKGAIECIGGPYNGFWLSDTKEKAEYSVLMDFDDFVMEGMSGMPEYKSPDYVMYIYWRKFGKLYYQRCCRKDQVDKVIMENAPCR